MIYYDKLTIHQRFRRLQANLLTDDGYRVITHRVAERFCERYDARISPSDPDFTGLPKEMLILYYDDLEIGVGSQLIAFVGGRKERIHGKTLQRPEHTN